MELEQKQTFDEINIKLQTQEEAEAFFDLIDKLDTFRTSTNWAVSPSDFTQKEVAMIITLSNARTNCEIVI